MKGRYITRSVEAQDVAELLARVINERCIIHPSDPSESMQLGDMLPRPPVRITGWFQGETIRRLRADYFDGCRLQFSISARGHVSRVRASLHFAVEARLP